MIATGLTLVGSVAAGAAFAGCSSSGSNGSSSSSGGGSGPGSCANPKVPIVFSPMYSAYIPGTTMHQFQIPAITGDGNMATWGASDPSMVKLDPQMFNGQPGVMITVQGTGPITIVATESDGSCGASVLNITSATEDDWQIGNGRYNDGVALHLGPPPGGFDGGRPEGGFPRPGGDGGSYFEEDGGTACTNCHGPTAANGPYKDVSHTPEQTGGFSDDDLIAIITQGIIPDGGYFDPTILIPSCDGSADCTQRAYSRWQRFHRWSDITSDEYKGMVVYLRSITPAPQDGTSNFGGRGGRDGGRPPRDSGGPPPPQDDGSAPGQGDAAGPGDAMSPVDATTTD